MASTSFMGLGFIGLGAMGNGMCRNVAAKHAGPVHAFDLDADALARVVAAGAIAAPSLASLAEAAEVIFLSLPGGEQVRGVCAELARHARPGTVIVDLSTTGVEDAREVARMLMADHGILFADAPVARARAAAETGTLSIMVGASADLFARIEPLLRTMGTDVTRCGETGCGQAVKLINNALLFVHVAALAEMMAAGERAGVDPETLLNVLSISSADSFALRNHGIKAMLPRDFPERAFSSAYTLKDLDYAIALCEEAGIDPKLPRLARSYYQKAVEAGIGEKYFPAIIELIEGR